MVDPPSTNSDNATDCNQNDNARENYEDVVFKWREFTRSANQNLPSIKQFPEMKTPDDFKTPEEFKNYVLYHLAQLNRTPLKLIASNTHMSSVSTLTATSAQQPHTPR